MFVKNKSLMISKHADMTLGSSNLDRCNVAKKIFSSKDQFIFMCFVECMRGLAYFALMKGAREVDLNPPVCCFSGRAISVKQFLSMSLGLGGREPRMSLK